MKCARPEDREQFRYLSPGMAKKIGQNVSLRPDWEDLVYVTYPASCGTGVITKSAPSMVKVEAMRTLVLQKFTDHKELARLLALTKQATLIEGNCWHDLFWGRCVCWEHNGEGRNELGKILMWVRDQLNARAAKAAKGQGKV